MDIGSIEWIKKCSTEEAVAWINEVEINTSEHVRRFNLIHWDYALTRAGILTAEPSTSGELVIDCSLLE